MGVKRTERGWGGHFILADRCLFRRNTLLEYEDIKIVVSTVGLLIDSAPEISKKYGKDGRFEEIGYNRYFETMAFHSMKEDERYQDADVSREVEFQSEWAISEIDADDKANDMHEEVVEEITNGLICGLRYE